MTAGPRARLLASTIEAVQELGVHGAGLSDLLKRANASRNSLYQHFPAGKNELVQVAARIVDRLVLTHLSKSADTLADANSVEDWIDSLMNFWRNPLESSGYAAGSFMMAAALDAENPELQAMAAHAFVRWQTELARGLSAAGVSPSQAASLSGVILSSIEGAIVQSRARRSSQPFTDLRTSLAALIHLGQAPHQT